MLILLAIIYLAIIYQLLYSTYVIKYYDLCIKYMGGKNNEVN